MGPFEWDTVARLHPALQVAADAGLTIGPDQVLQAFRVAAEAWTWSRLACQAAQPGWLRDLLPAGAGGWMDEGILSRWLLDTLPSIATLLEQITPITTTATAARLRVVLDHLGITADP